MAVIKRKYNNADGKTVIYSNYWIKFRDHNNVIRRISGFSSKTTSLELERSIKRLVGIRQVNGILETADIKFLESCPYKLLHALVKFGIIDPIYASFAKSMSDHIADFKSAMTVNAGTEKYVKETVAYVN